MIEDPSQEVLDFSGQEIDNIEHLMDLVFMKMPNLKELNLSNNYIREVPANLPLVLTRLESINLNNNGISQEPEVFNSVIDILAQIGVGGEDYSGGLKALFINLTREEQVDYILKQMPQLEFLNGLAVDRDELYSNEEAGSDEE